MMSAMYPQSASASMTSFYPPPVMYNQIPEEYVPPSSSPGDPFRPTIELDKPVYEINSQSPVCTVSGEIELDTSLFGSLPYSIGIAFSVPELNQNKPIEWNQDPRHTPYHRSRSYIQMADRLIVDNTCYLKFKIDVPPSLLPPNGKASRVYEVDVKCYALDRPELATKPSSVQFMIFNRNGGKSSSGGRRTSVY
ncbi:hypothetical protein FRB96_007999 [Tulasnella sp. 330]|nr:hypothetical protein FRB96_007999 [Tulasnella sp. 330]KAG8875804.1 hypothetical protein FRB98_007576 [Tulasnella sp. 332]KAG8881288.1 hypothetical protein FRB97_009701 [Tulasnella sp. 331]